MTNTLAPIGIDRATFVQCFNRLAKAKRAAQTVDEADVQIYYQVLRPFPRWAIEAAADTLMTQTTFGMPRTDIWVQACEAAVQQRLRETLTHGRAWEHECADCQDSGWRPVPDCTADNRCGRPFCERNGPSYTHTMVGVCPCRPHNHTYRRHTLGSALGHGSHGGNS